MNNLNTIENKKLVNLWLDKAITQLTSIRCQISEHKLGIEEINSEIKKLDKLDKLKKLANPNKLIYFKHVLNRSEKLLEMLNEKYNYNLSIFLNILKDSDNSDNISLMRIATI